MEHRTLRYFKGLAAFLVSSKRLPNVFHFATAAVVNRDWRIDAARGSGPFGKAGRRVLPRPRVERAESHYLILAILPEAGIGQDFGR